MTGVRDLSVEALLAYPTTMVVVTDANRRGRQAALVSASEDDTLRDV